jgi:hypothetical protein
VSCENRHVATYLLQSSRFAQIFTSPLGDSSLDSLGRNWTGDGPNKKLCFGMLLRVWIYVGVVVVSDILNNSVYVWKNDFYQSKGNTLFPNAHDVNQLMDGVEPPRATSDPPGRSRHRRRAYLTDSATLPKDPSISMTHRDGRMSGVGFRCNILLFMATSPQRDKQR